jgi:hypothetical protein
MEDEKVDLSAALNELLMEMEDEIEDSHEFFLRLTQTLNGMRAMGMPVPADLERLEAELAEEFEGDMDE